MFRVGNTAAHPPQYCTGGNLPPCSRSALGLFPGFRRWIAVQLKTSHKSRRVRATLRQLRRTQRRKCAAMWFTDMGMDIRPNTSNISHRAKFTVCRSLAQGLPPSFHAAHAISFLSRRRIFQHPRTWSIICRDVRAAGFKYNSAKQLVYSLSYVD